MLSLKCPSSVEYGIKKSFEFRFLHRVIEILSVANIRPNYVYVAFVQNFRNFFEIFVNFAKMY